MNKKAQLVFKAKELTAEAMRLDFIRRRAEWDYQEKRVEADLAILDIEMQKWLDELAEQATDSPPR